MKKAVAVFTNTGRIGKYADVFDWPEYIDSECVERKIDVMGAWEGNSEKYYFKEAMSKGWCAAQYPDGIVFALSFSEKKVPYLGILHNTGSFRGIYNLFLEPCTATFDRPDFAAARGQNSVIKAKSTYKWYMNITIEKIEKRLKSVDEYGKLTV
jgi:hypothetical protein